MITTVGENVEFKLYRVKENSAYEWEDQPYLIFYGRFANNIEKKQYRIQQGVNGSSESLYIISSNLLTGIKPGDRIVFLDKASTVENVGYYFNNSRLINFKCFNSKYILSRSPKGIMIA